MTRTRQVTVLSKDRLKKIARDLALTHMEMDPQTVWAAWFPDPSGKTVRLLELVRGIERMGRRRKLRPFVYAPVPEEGLPVELHLVLVHPEDAGDLTNARTLNHLLLPAGWDIEQMEAWAREEAVAHA
jgi:hypothetical protein